MKREDAEMIGLLRTLDWLRWQFDIGSIQQQIDAGVDRLVAAGLVEAPTSWDHTIPRRTDLDRYGKPYPLSRTLYDAELSVRNAGMTVIWVQPTETRKAAIDSVATIASAMIERVEVQGLSAMPWSLSFPRHIAMDDPFNTTDGVGFVLGFSTEADLIWAKMVL